MRIGLKVITEAAVLTYFSQWYRYGLFITTYIPINNYSCMIKLFAAE